MFGQNGKLMYRLENGQSSDYYYLGKKEVAKRKGTSVTYVHTDFLGSPVAESNNDGAVLSRMHYAPFGAPLEQPKNDTGYTGHEFDTDLGLNYMQARYYDPVIGRFYANDPLGFRDIHSFNRYAYANNNPFKYVDPDGKDAIAIVFPDYKISTGFGKVSGLGHAGVLLVDNKSGLTKYYEYGRYDKANLGIVRQRTVPNVEMKNGMPTETSLKATLDSISKQSGQGGAISGAYIKNDNFKAMNDFAKDQMSSNSDPNRTPYDLTNNQCGTFMKDVIEAGGVDTPWMIDPRPNSYIEELRDDFKKIDN
jgi:RHS repeat-associated protein